MSRTWVLYDTDSTTGDELVNSGSFQYTQAGINTIYFITMGQTGAGTGNTVWSYDGTTLTEVGFGDFLTAQGYTSPTGCTGICYFNGDIYVSITYDSGNHGIICKYDILDDSWSEVKDFGAVSGGIGRMYADDNFAVVAASDWYESTDGTNWTKCQYSGGDMVVSEHAVCINRDLIDYGDYSLIIGRFVGGGDYEPYQRGATLWESLRGATSSRIVNYHNDLAIWSGDDGATDKDLYKTTAFGAGYTDCTDAPYVPVTDNWIAVQHFGSDCGLAYYSTQDDIYEWTFASGLYELGATSEEVGFFFRLGSTVYYADGSSAVAEQIDFYTGGSFTPPSAPSDGFYYFSGALEDAVLEKKIDLSIPVTTIEGMAVDDKQGKVNLASSYDETVIELNSADDFSFEKDITDSLDDTTSSIRRVT